MPGPASQHPVENEIETVIKREWKGKGTAEGIHRQREMKEKGEIARQQHAVHAINTLYERFFSLCLFVKSL